MPLIEKKEAMRLLKWLLKQLIFFENQENKHCNYVELAPRRLITKINFSLKPIQIYN